MTCIPILSRKLETIRTSGGESARLHSKLVMGPWTHAIEDVKIGSLEFPAAHWYGMQKTRLFMDYWPWRGGQRFPTSRSRPFVYYWRYGEDRWRTAKVWPPKNALKKSTICKARPFAFDGLAAAGRSRRHGYSVRSRQSGPHRGGHVLDPALHGGPQDQREKVESRDDALVFSTPALSKAVRSRGK